jgi:release factor glutamine methyltransferase
MNTVATALKQAAERLRLAGTDNPRLDARLLLGAALEVENYWLFNHPNAAIDATDIERFEALLARRCAREPVSLILGRREFWSMEFRVTPDTLTPRPDSETVIEAVLQHLPQRDRPLAILDLGTGTGCLLLALLEEYRNAQGLGVDRSEAALSVAADNAARLGFGGRSRFLRSDWCDGVEGRFHCIVCNPPYIASADIAGLEPEVAQFEPAGALDGGADGLDDYRRLARQIPGRLEPDGIAAFEVGAGQAAQVAALLTDAGLAIRAIRQDLGGIERCVVASF